jgi:hypothetical protein
MYLIFNNIHNKIHNMLSRCMLHLQEYSLCYLSPQCFWLLSQTPLEELPVPKWSVTTFKHGASENFHNILIEKSLGTERIFISKLYISLACWYRMVISALSGTEDEKGGSQDHGQSGLQSETCHKQNTNKPQGYILRGYFNSKIWSHVIKTQEINKFSCLRNTNSKILIHSYTKDDI